MARVYSVLVVGMVLGLWWPGQASHPPVDHQAPHAPVDHQASHLHVGHLHPPAPAPPSNCQYWCRTPEDHFYCCRDNHTSDPTEHDGYCPATRAVCPTTYKPLPTALPRLDDNGVTFPDFPRFCATDGSCESYEKCCFDRCFRRHMCKFAFSEDGHLTYSNEEGLQADVVQHAFAYDPNRLHS